MKEKLYGTKPNSKSSNVNLKQTIMKTQKFILALLLIFTFTSCSKNYDSKSYTENREISIESENNDRPSTLMKNSTIPNGELKLASTIEQPAITTDRMIIRKGTMNIETENYPEKEKEIFRIVNTLDGYISNSGSTMNTSGKKQGKIDIRILAKKFDTLISKISNTGKVMSLNINSSDITEEFIDLEAREKTQKALEERLIKVLNEKTAKLTDIVEVEQKLADVRSQIESMQGRMRFLKNQTEYSTLTVSLFEPSLIQTTSGGGFFYELSMAFKKGLDGFTDIIAGLITFAVATSPVLILIFLILFILRRFYLKWKIRRDSVNIQTS